MTAGVMIDDIRTGDIAIDTLWTGATPHGRQYAMRVRPGTSDWNTVNACAWPHDEYHLPADLSGWALDIGAHIGAATIPLLLDNPDLRVIAVEALPENTALLAYNAERNGVACRLTIMRRAAANTDAPVTIGYPADEQHRYIGNADHPTGAQRSVAVKGITLRGLMLLRGPDAQDEPFAWTKIDCEGCEYPLLDSPVAGALTRIAGEHHAGLARITALLGGTHAVHLVTGTSDFGTFRADAMEPWDVATSELAEAVA